MTCRRIPSEGPARGALSRVVSAARRQLPPGHSPRPATAARVTPVTSPLPLASGRTADVFAVDDNRVLRRYRDGGDVAAEAAVMIYVGGRGFPVPRVFSASGPDIVMERLDGPTMLDALLAGDLDIPAAAEMLADLLARLHELPARLARDPAVRVLHLDLHPGNILLSSRGPVVIDWPNAVEGPPDLDIALSALILAEVAVGDRPEVASAARMLLTEFLARADGDLLRGLERAVAIRRANPTLSAEEIDRLAVAAALIGDVIAAGSTA